jgi:hypothetical protein
VRHVAHQQSLQTRSEGATDSSQTDLASLRMRARKGDARAKRELAGPPFPEALRYLWRWFQRFYRGLPHDATGHKEATWVQLEAWSRRADVDLQPHEADALLLLADVVRDPSAYMKKAKAA